MRTKGPARPGWPQVLDTLPTPTVCAFTGLLPQNLSRVRNGHMDSPSADLRLSALAAAAAQPHGSVVIDRGLVTIARLGTTLAKDYPTQPERWPGLLKQTLRHITYVSTPADVDLFFSAPAVREPRLLALLAGTAALAAHRIGQPAPAWAAKTYLPQPWDVLEEATSPHLVPVEFASRGVLLDARHLTEPERTGTTGTQAQEVGGAR